MTQSRTAKQVLTRPLVVVLVLLSIAYVTYTLCRFYFPLALSSIQKEFGLTLVQAGFLSTAYLFSQGVASFLIGPIADKYGSGKVLILSCLVNGLFTSLLVVATGFIDVTFYQVGFGVGQGMFNTVVYAMAAFLGGVEWRGRMTAIINYPYQVMSFVTPVVTGFLLLGSPTAWRMVALVYGIITIISGVILLIWWKKAEQAVLDERVRLGLPLPADSKAKSGEPPFSVWKSLKILGTGRNCYLSLAISGFENMFRWGWLALGPLFLVNAWHLSLLDAGVIMSAGNLSGVVGALLVSGYLTDKIGRRYTIIVFGISMSVCGILFFDFAPHNVLLLSILSFGFQYGNNGEYNVTMNVMQDSVADERALGTATGLVQAFRYLFGGFAGPLFAGLWSLYGPEFGANVGIILLGCALPTFLAFFIKETLVKKRKAA